MGHQLAEFGVTAATDNSVILTPRKWPDGGISTVPGILWHHGGGGTVLGSGGQLNPSLIGTYPLIMALADHWPVMVSDFTGPGSGGNGWGNAADVASMEAGRLRLIAATGCKTGGVMIGGESMGHASCVQYATAHRATTLGIFASIPLCSLAALYATNALGVGPGMGLAWGVTYPAALPGAALVENQAAGLNGLPWKVWASPADTVVSFAAAQAFATAIGGTLVAAGNYDHSEQSVAAAPITDIVKFVYSVLGTWVP